MLSLALQHDFDPRRYPDMSCCHAQMQSRSGAAALETAEGSMEGAGADLSRQVSFSFV